MSVRTKIIVAIIAAVATLWLGYRTASRWYFEPRASLNGTIASLTTTLAKYRDARSDRPRLDRELQTIINQTLGGDVENVEHQLRTRLNRLCEHVGLANFTVNSTTTVRRLSPARQSFTRGPLRDEVDFIEVPGSIIGQGTFEQMLRLVAGIEDEPWIKRLDQVKIDPKDNGGKFDVTLRLTTLFLPGRSPAADPLTAVAVPDLTPYAAFVRINPFRLPPAPAVAAAPKQPANPVPTGFPYEQWSLTGVAESPAGSEVWLLNAQTHESKRLAVGEHLQDVVFAAASGDSAEFTLNDLRFRVSVGQNLNDRTPVNQ